MSRLNKVGNVLMTVGTTGSGKSYFTACADDALSERVSLKTTLIRRELGLAEFGKSTPHQNFTRGNVARTMVYDEIASRATKAASNSMPWILLDGAYESQELRQKIYSVAERWNYNVICLYFHCPRTLAIDRIKARVAQNHPAAEADDVRILDYIENSFTPPFADQEITTALSTIIDLNSALMTAGFSQPRDSSLASDLAPLLHASGYEVGRTRHRIGLDFDGVIANTYKAKRDYVASHYGVALRESETDRENGIRLLGAEAYMAMIRDIYSSELTYKLEEMPGAIKTIQKIDHLADCYVITARQPEEVDRMRRWIDDHRLMVHGIIGTSEEPKRRAIESLGLSLFLDDSERNLLGLEARHGALLFDPFDVHKGNPAGLRIKSWDEIYRLVRQCTQE